MPYDEKVALRLKTYFEKEKIAFVERKMMGGLILMVDGHMCCGASDDGLMLRIGPAARPAALKKPHVRPLDIGGGRTPSAFVHVGPEGFATEAALKKWVQLAIEFVATLPPK